MNDARITACCDIDIERAKAWAGQYGGIPFFPDMKTMLAREKPDAVILCTWPSLHVAQIETCLASGIRSILCEKALVLNGRDAYRIGELAMQYGAFVMEAEMYRHHPAIRTLETFLSRPETGKIDSVRAVFSNFEPGGTADWRLRPECGGGVPYDWMSYCVNACNHFSGGKPLRVFASGSVSVKHGVIDRLYGVVEYENGVVGIIESSRSASFSEMLQLTCEGCILELPIAWGIFGKVKINRRHRKQEWDYIVTDTTEIAAADSYRIQIENFCNCIRGTETPAVTLAESIVNAFTTDALVESAMAKAVVDVRERIVR
jgi:predicted dehydrogenase